MFDIENYDKNSNAVEVGNLIFNEKKDEAKTKVGFFNKYGRVKLIRLGGTPSYGYLFSPNELANVYPDVLNVNYNELIDYDFDTVCGELFVQVYVPPVKEGTPRASRGAKRQKKLQQFDRLVPGQFQFHYDTSQLNRCINEINTTDLVSITVKLHGTSICLGNIKTKKPKYSGFYEKIYLYLPKFLQFTKEEYDLIYSSRTVIKNRYVNKKVTDGYYGTDIWGEYAEKLDGKIPQGTMVYGEIVGYITGSQKMIQKGYDYKCPVGTNKLMIYRITTDNGDGTKFEWNISEVYEWTLKLMRDYPEISKYIHPIDVLYHGTLSQLYPDIDTTTHWHENVLEAMKKDKKHFGMEMNEPLCNQKVPREGIVLRIDNDTTPEAFKLKTDLFFGRESALVSSGEVDIEMEEGYGEEN